MATTALRASAVRSPRLSSRSNARNRDKEQGKQAVAEENAMDPIHQFAIQPIVSLHPFGIDATFTNASLFMVIVSAAVAALMLVGTSSRALVPGRLQSVAEMAYDFVKSTFDMAGLHDGMRFFPFVFTLFLFVLFCNVIGLIPYTFTVTSQIAVTGALALLVIGIVVVYGFMHNGTRFLRLFVPSGVPIALMPFLVPIEIISFLSRPVSLSVRLFANMLAGHITLKVMGGFVVSLLGAGFFAVLAPLPFAMAIILTAFELLVAVLQAYVFAILTCVYLNDAIHPGH
jgi:F-type H+-transporting ATPase subunit a